MYERPARRQNVVGVLMISIPFSTDRSGDGWCYLLLLLLVCVCRHPSEGWIRGAKRGFHILQLVMR